MNMDFFPELQLTLFNGWFLFIWYVIIIGIITIIVPKEVRTRLFDRANFTKSQKIITVIEKSLALVFLILIFLTPLAYGSLDFIVGLIIFILGMIGIIIATYDFAKTPLDEPVTRRLYKISRHPQETMIAVILLGVSIAIGSLFAVLFHIFLRILTHFRLVAEEQACLQQYGESYQEYLDRVPRYFLFF
ncbi:MAG: methyltransferase family protein [Candidatus Hermodarchaeota archaeon]